MNRNQNSTGNIGVSSSYLKRRIPTIQLEVAKMNPTTKTGTQLTLNSKALIGTLLFRLLFGGYLMGMDQYSFNDIDSALTVLVIYGLIAIFAIMFLLGKRRGLLGIIGLDIIFITLQVGFTIATLTQTVDPGLHNAINNWWATLLMLLFSLLTLVFAIKTYREKEPPNCSLNCKVNNT
jgi:hypothetical protein